MRVLPTKPSVFVLSCRPSSRLRTQLLFSNLSVVNVSPKKHVASPSVLSAGATAKDRKVSAKQEDAAMTAVETDVIQARVSSMIEAVNEEQFSCERSATQCHAICVKRKKREAEHILHRKMLNVGGTALVRREDTIKKCGHFKGAVLQTMLADKRGVSAWYFYLSGYTSSTTLDVISLPVENSRG